MLVTFEENCFNSTSLKIIVFKDKENWLKCENYIFRYGYLLALFT